ncbi:lasso peptide biosynthesis PqqD family chaperone [Cytophagaceae bacterium 50C-KIRBA]|uniref:Lasso peptide biosynthesis PqqD family chaperone n=1 Tax=Aquirufa beregesia TaxID=2516556 RepID=A0ABX0EX56_9BACT|nr:lasso peptide biosynthesis PqqD family chaperone [Aquirufa beregesia]NGZ44656.1 lasso peptide biosynthesis PqqD family chaperone [Aquirufa beregesia]
MQSPIYLTLESVISRNSSHIVSNVLHDEIVIMDLKNGNYLNLNRIGSSIWNLIEKPISVHDLIQMLLAKYQVEAHECHTHVFEFLNTLEQHDLLVIQL